MAAETKMMVVLMCVLLFSYLVIWYITFRQIWEYQ